MSHSSKFKNRPIPIKLSRQMDGEIQTVLHEMFVDQLIKANTITIAEAARRLKMPSQIMNSLVRQGKVQAIKHRNRWRMTEADFQKLHEMMIPPVDTDWT